MSQSIQYNTFGACPDSRTRTENAGMADSSGSTDASPQVRQALGARIKALREQAGLTQAQLGERVELSERMISQIERGLKGTKLARLELMARILGVSLPELFAFDDTPAQDKERRRAIRELVRLVQDEEAETIKQVTRHARLVVRFMRRRQGAWDRD